MIPVALGGEIVSTFGRPELVKLGECKVIEEVMIGEDKVSASFSHKCGILSSTDVYMPVYNRPKTVSSRKHSNLKQVKT